MTTEFSWTTNEKRVHLESKIHRTYGSQEKKGFSANDKFVWMDGTKCDNKKGQKLLRAEKEGK